MAPLDGLSAEITKRRPGRKQHPEDANARSGSQKHSRARPKQKDPFPLPRSPRSPKRAATPLMSGQHLKTPKLLGEAHSHLKALTPYLGVFQNNSLFDEFRPTQISSKGSGHADVDKLRQSGRSKRKHPELVQKRSGPLRRVGYAPETSKRKSYGYLQSAKWEKHRHAQHVDLTPYQQNRVVISDSGPNPDPTYK